MGKISYIERRKRNFSIQILKIEKRKGFFLQNLINREEKEKFFLKVLKFEKWTRIWFSNSWKSRRKREMKVQFSRSREKKMSNFSRRFSRDRDSCHRLLLLHTLLTIRLLLLYLAYSSSWLIVNYILIIRHPLCELKEC